jgi:hypothetical protein
MILHYELPRPRVMDPGKYLPERQIVSPELAKIQSVVPLQA